MHNIAHNIQEKGMNLLLDKQMKRDTKKRVKREKPFIIKNDNLIFIHCSVVFNVTSKP